MTLKLKILAVDDEPTITSMIRRLLAPNGYEVIEVNDPRKVEEYILYTDLSLVITDVNMPDLDGLEVLKIIKKSRPDLPVLVLTGVNTLETAVEATKLGASEYLTKPLNKESLIKAIEKNVQVDQVLPDSIKETIELGTFTDAGDSPIEPERILLEDEILSTESIPPGLLEVRFDSIIPGQFLSFGMFIQIYNKQTRRHYLRKISHENTVFTSGLAELLSKRQLGSVFIKEHDYEAYLEYISAIKNAPGFAIQKVRDQKKRVLYGKALEAVTGILTGPVENKNIKAALILVDDVFQTIIEDPVAYQDMYRLFKRDTGIFNHSANVCLLVVSFGIFLGAEKATVNTWGFGALFHDIGMNRVDKHILEKTTPLTRDEWREIHKHPERGLTLIKATPLVPVPALRIILEHHEHEDGSGYPRGLRGTQISHQARVCRIVDKFDSMTTEKPYRAAFKAPDALKRIYYEESAPRYQTLVRRFIEFLGGSRKMA